MAEFLVNAETELKSRGIAACILFDFHILTYFRVKQDFKQKK